MLIWDIAAGSHYSLFVGDMAVNKPDVYVCGRQPRYSILNECNCHLTIYCKAINKL